MNRKVPFCRFLRHFLPSLTYRAGGWILLWYIRHDRPTTRMLMISCKVGRKLALRVEEPAESVPGWHRKRTQLNSGFRKSGQATGGCTEINSVRQTVIDPQSVLLRRSDCRTAGMFTTDSNHSVVRICVVDRILRNRDQRLHSSNRPWPRDRFDLSFDTSRWKRLNTSIRRRTGDSSRSHWRH